MINRILIVIIALYRYFISPFYVSCRFYPTCSVYAENVLIRYGIFKGVFLICKRLIKCNPFFKGGYDPCP